MKEQAAYLLLVLGGKAAPTAADVEALLVTSGTTADATVLAAIIAKAGADGVDALIATGTEALISVGGGSGGGGGGGGGEEAAVEEEKEVEEEEEIDMGGGGGLFGGEEEDGY